MLNLIKPPKLQVGDKIAAVSLSWGGASVFPERYALGKKRLQEIYGIQVVESRHALRDTEWLSANPKARADDLMESFSDPTIKGIFTIIGGEDSIRLLPHIDYRVIRENPKAFLGYSDSTVGHFMCLKAGLSSFYGPSILAEFAENVEVFPYTTEFISRVLFSSGVIGEVNPSINEWSGQYLPWDVPENVNKKRQRSKPAGPQLLQGAGKVQGRLIGGCIEVLDWLRGTSLWPSNDQWDSAILFIETSEERPSPQAVSYMLRCLGVLGVYERISGLIVGRPMCDPVPDQMLQYDAVLHKIICNEFGKGDLPIMTQMDFGHSDPKMVLPYGAMAEIDCNRKVFSILESGVA